MNVDYAFTPEIWVPFLTILFVGWLSVHSWKRRSVPGAVPFSIACLFAILWGIGSILELAALEFSGKLFWLKFQTVWFIPAASAVTCFIFDYAYPGRFLTRRNLFLFSIPSLVTLFMVVTNDQLRLMAVEYLPGGQSIGTVAGPGYWFSFGFAYLLTAVNLIVFTWLFVHSPPHRVPVMLMFIGQVAGRLAHLLGNSTLAWDPWISRSLPFLIPYSLYGLALFSFRFFDPTPVARQTVVEQMQEGMLVVDNLGKVTALNPAAAKCLKLTQRQARGKALSAILPRAAGLEELVQAPREMSLDQKTCLVTTSLVKDWRGFPIGYLLLLHDITDQKQAQQHLIAQQTALATLTERERLARELHDSIGQVFGYTSYQAAAVYKLLEEGQVDTALAQLDRLREVVKSGAVDLRESIQNLRISPSDSQPFFTTVRKYLESYGSDYGIQAGLTIDASLSESALPPEAQLQIFRILQEALSNARKHGRAHCVQVTFELRAGMVVIGVQDDGAGFDPALVTPGDQHFGLQFMRERAEQMGGRLKVQSAPGRGTNLAIDLPYMEVPHARLAGG